MKFNAAVKAMKLGKKVRRQAFTDRLEYLFLDEDECICQSHETKGKKLILLEGIEADDWEIFGESKAHHMEDDEKEIIRRYLQDQLEELDN